MNKFTHIILSLVAVAVVGFATSSAFAAEPKKAEAKASPAAAETKITKEQAQNLVLKKYIGAQITTCELGTDKGNSVWIVTFTQTGGHAAQKVQVDAQNGKVTRL